jgi:hypothetical protein
MGQFFGCFRSWFLGPLWKYWNSFFICIPRIFFVVFLKTTLVTIKTTLVTNFSKIVYLSKRARSNKCKTYYLSSDKPFKCKVKPRSKPPNRFTKRKDLHPLFIYLFIYYLLFPWDPVGILERKGKTIVKFCKKQNTHHCSRCLQSSKFFACKVT